MAIAPFIPGSASITARNNGRIFVDLRAQLDDLQRQLATNQRSETYGGLGFERRTSLDVRAKLSAIDGYQSTIQDGEVRVNILDQGISSIATLTNDTRNDAASSQFILGSDGQTPSQKLAKERLSQALDILNTDVGSGTYIYGGRKTDTKPVDTIDHILNGDGTLAGVTQLISERKQADLGNGLGRTTLSTSGTTVTLAEEAAGLPFGFKITTAATTGTGVSAAYTAGPPASAAFTVGAQPADGDVVRIGLTLPDGSQESIELTARNPNNPLADDNAFTIGATTAQTTTNLNAAINTAVRVKASSALAAASATIGANSFFEGSASTPPQRIQGPFATATGFTSAATAAATTVIWYKGDDTAPSARETASVRIDATNTVAIGVQANETAFKNALSGLAVLASEKFSGNTPQESARYSALNTRVRTELATPGSANSVEAVELDIANANLAMKSADERHTARKSLLTETLSKVENPSLEEVSASVLSLQTRLQASYQVTSIISKLSLSNYI